MLFANLAYIGPLDLSQLDLEIGKGMVVAMIFEQSIIRTQLLNNDFYWSQFYGSSAVRRSWFNTPMKGKHRYSRSRSLYVAVRALPLEKFVTIHSITNYELVGTFPANVIDFNISDPFHLG